MIRFFRLVGLTWWLQLKMRSRSAFDGLLSLIWPLFFATTIFLIYRHTAEGSSAMLTAAVGAAMMGVWSSTSTTAAFALQQIRRQGVLELLVAAPAPFALLIVPITLSMATVGAYSVFTTLVWGRFVFGIHLAIAEPFMFVVAVVATIFGIGMLGFLVSVNAVRYRSAWALGSALEMPIWLLCGFLISLSSLPAWVRPVSWILAPTWGMSAVHAATRGRNSLPSIAVCVGLGLAYGLIGAALSRVLLTSARVRATLALS